MKPHKHADVLRAIADGKQLQRKGIDENEWIDCPVETALVRLSMDMPIRIKPERKPDLVWYASVYDKHIGNTTSVKETALRWKSECRGIIVITFDGETGELKAEVLK